LVGLPGVLLGGELGVGAEEVAPGELLDEFDGDGGR
jgi:hypothetical protein